MCGIIGMLKRQESEETLREAAQALKRLEYRGYDSWGYAFLNGGKVEMEKRIGRISIPNIHSKARVAVLHTRWATHGGVTEENAHPHLDCTGRIAVVHNGIIENYLDLKEQLIQRKHLFKSQTDSEVVAHLLEETEGSLYERAKQIAPRLKGSFALVIMDASSTSELVAIKNESPLCMGIGEDRIVFASDPLAFLDYTSKVIYLEEGELGYARQNNGNFELRFFDIAQQKEIQKQPITLPWKNVDNELKEYPHYMLKEIFEQPKALLAGMDLESAQTMADALKGRRVVVVACGTARHAGVIGKHILHRIAKFPVDVIMAHEASYFMQDLDPDTVLLAISQSGETADVMECVRKAKARGIQVYSIVNVPSSTLARESKYVFYINCGPEIAVASTKAFTNQILAFYLLAYIMAGKREEVKKQLIDVSKLLAQYLPYLDQKAREVALSIKNKKHVYMLGRGVNFPIALEGALKMKEISYIHAEGMPAGELKHGTLALVEKGTPVILLAPSDYTYEDSISNGMETKARGAMLIGISDKAHPSFSIWTELPKLENPIFYPLFETAALQLIAYHTAVTLGRDVDKPRNLAKSVTVK
ncbi:MAG TPA: glutamine--fructose-6-phosphate transaminase (isomerizing) [Candidatus Bilamarchaeaceae archaeon]|nr:glutamine--fructose-6-phosphate transaminase (isomerizing) [Candidatus Bilamarchaeaceae archaeon]